LFTDAQCKNPVLSESAGGPCTNPPPPTTASIQLAVSMCGAHYAYYKIGAKIATPAQLYSFNGGCQVTTVQPTADYYATTEVGPAALAPLTDVRE
jgi:hypothetical protein